MHAQEVVQEVLALQEHASGKKELNYAFNARSSKQGVQNPIRKKTQEATSPTANRKKFTVVGLTSNRYLYIYNHVYGKREWQNVILISLLFLLRKRRKNI